MSSPVIVNIFTNESKTFEDVKEITIGRNLSASIDIPSSFISRTQCIVTLTENNEWSLADVSQHKTTLLNDIPFIGRNPILKNGDKISFLCYKDAEYKFYYSVSDVPNPAKRRKLNRQKDCTVETKIPIENEDENLNSIPKLPQKLEITELNNELATLKEKYELALNEINKQRRTNETVTQKLSTVLKESDDTVSSLQKEKEILSNKLKEGEEAKEKLVLEIQELNELLKESELEQMRLTDECTCKGTVTEVSSEVDKPELFKEDVTASEADALQKLVEIVEMKWNEQEMEHMRDELKKRDEKITDLALESQKYHNEIVDTLDHEMLCSICNDILYEATTLNCKHTFCKVCVIEWKKKKKECPVCRTRIKTETHPLVIDSFIDKLAETLGGELKTRRAEVREERSVKTTRNSGHSASTRRAASYNRNSRRTRGNFNSISSAMNNIMQPFVIELPDRFNPGIVSAPIDLTNTATPPPRRRGRSGSIVGYYNL